MTVRRPLAATITALVVALALVGCGGSSEPAASTTTAPTVASAPSVASPAPTAIPAHVPGTYVNGDWVVRLAADGTWEEDLRGQVNAYGGSYTVDGDQVVLRDRRGSSETARLQGDELRLPSITLTRR